MKAKQPLALRTLYTISSSPPKLGVSRHHRENNDWLKNKKANRPVSTLVEARQKHAGTVHSQIWGGVGGFRSKGSIYPSGVTRSYARSGAKLKLFPPTTPACTPYQIVYTL